MLRVSLVILLLFFLAAVAFVGAHGAWLKRFLRRREAGLVEGRTILARVVSSPTLDSSDVAQLRALPQRVQLRLLIELIRHLGGDVRDRMQLIAAELGIVERARELSDSPFWWDRLQALRVLTALAREEEALRFLKDRNSAVRAQAVEWAGDHPTPAVVRALLDMLDDPDTVSRFAVQDSVLRLGLVVAEPLAAKLAAASGPAVIPALEVAAALGQGVFAGPAIRLCSDSDARVRARAADVLGAIHASDGIDALTQLLIDPVAEVRAAAAQALGRIGHWPAATSVARLLRDPAFDVRRSAGLALRLLGSPGMLLLARYRSDADHFAADMARQVLDLPDTRHQQTA